MREIARFLGGSPPERQRRANRLAWTAYLTGGLLSCLAGLFNPLGMYLVAISAAAFAFGGTSGLAWMMQMIENPRLPKPPAPPFAVARSWPWIVVGAAVFAAFVGVFGPSVEL